MPYLLSQNTNISTVLILEREAEARFAPKTTISFTSESSERSEIYGYLERG